MGWDRGGGGGGGGTSTAFIYMTLTPTIWESGDLIYC